MLKCCVLCPPGEGGLSSDCLALIAKARELSQRVTALLPFASGSDAQAALASGADTALVLTGDTALAHDDLALAKALLPHVRSQAPDALLTHASVTGRSLAPCLSALLQTGLTADCIALSLDENGLLRQTRPAFGSRVEAEILCPDARPQMASVRAGVFVCPPPLPSQQGKVIHASLTGSARVTQVGFTPLSQRTPLTDAHVILVGGKGAGAEGFRQLEALADRFHAVVGATRAAVDAGFAPYSRQIGLTGVTVHPRLYIAVGVSGAAQHIAGMSASGTVVAVNSDKSALIFQFADYAIVADWREVLPKIIPLL